MNMKLTILPEDMMDLNILNAVANAHPMAALITDAIEELLSP
jgi:hypothetical protein